MLTHRQIMWEESWINLMMKMRDMPYYHYKAKADRKVSQQERDAIPGDADTLIRKFGKYASK